MGYSKYNTTRFQKDVPVKEGEIYDVEIEGMGEKGDGIAKVRGYVIIVPGVKKGDKVKIKVTAVRGRVSFGEVVGEAEEAPAETEEAAEEEVAAEEEEKQEGSEEESEEDVPAEEESEEEAPEEEEKKGE